eukprot:gene4281-biopygen20424
MLLGPCWQLLRAPLLRAPRRPAVPPATAAPTALRAARSAHESAPLVPPPHQFLPTCGQHWQLRAQPHARRRRAAPGVLPGPAAGLGTPAGPGATPAQPGGRTRVHGRPAPARGLQARVPGTAARAAVHLPLAAPWPASSKHIS